MSRTSSRGSERNAVPDSHRETNSILTNSEFEELLAGELQHAREDDDELVLAVLGARRGARAGAGSGGSSAPLRHWAERLCKSGTLRGRVGWLEERLGVLLPSQAQEEPEDVDSSGADLKKDPPVLCEDDPWSEAIADADIHCEIYVYPRDEARFRRALAHLERPLPSPPRERGGWSMPRTW